MFFFSAVMGGAMVRVAVGEALLAGSSPRRATYFSCSHKKSRQKKCAPPRPRAPQVARSEAEGRSQWGRLFFGYFLLAEQKKVTAPPGAHPGQQRIQ
ncbi:MAG TPA: hypothetical protein PLA28_12040, partial [Ottowia sp.]|nr:hypothetical protein [Ottowia sp.]